MNQIPILKEQLERLTVKQLREFASNITVDPKGNRKVLMSRLVEHLTTNLLRPCGLADDPRPKSYKIIGGKVVYSPSDTEKIRRREAQLSEKRRLERERRDLLARLKEQRGIRDREIQTLKSVGWEPSRIAEVYKLKTWQVRYILKKA